ncbi:class I SAM-dependent methyltransferase [Patescibacteria group bacterium]|nr:class I SAM-dependent methyltransferase [Patescibacteria group bacterium]
MRKRALDFYACPACKTFPLFLSHDRDEVIFNNLLDVAAETYQCKQYCSRNRRMVNSQDDAYALGCKKCHEEQVKTATLTCKKCGYVFCIENFLPNFRLDHAKKHSSDHCESLGKGVVQKHESFYTRAEQEKELYRRVKALLPFSRAKKPRAKKNMEDDLEYRSKYPEKDKYIPVFEEYLSKKPVYTLELGIGQGGFTSSVKKFFKPAVSFGLDYEPKWAEIAWIRDPETEVLTADARKLPFRDSSIDLVFSAYTLEHIVNVDPVIHETARVADEAFLVFGPSKWSLYDVHFEKAPLVPLLPAFLAKRLAYLWKVKKVGFNYAQGEIFDEYATMNYIRPSYFERLAHKAGFKPVPLLKEQLTESFKEAYQYHSIMKVVQKFGFIVLPIVSLVEKMKLQPFMVYFLKKEKATIVEKKKAKK